MKVSIYKEKGGTLALLVQASPGKGRSPLTVGGVSLGDIRATTLSMIKAIKEPKEPK